MSISSHAWQLQSQFSNYILIASTQIYTSGIKRVPGLRKFFKQIEVEMVSNSRNKIHQTWGQLFGPTLAVNEEEQKLSQGTTDKAHCQAPSIVVTSRTYLVRGTPHQGQNHATCAINGFRRRQSDTANTQLKREVLSW